MEYAIDLNRFIEDQNSIGFAGYNNAVEEIKNGKKLSHWIWYVFPQFKFTFDDKDKYSMSFMALLGDTPIQLDSAISKFSFLYNNENSSEEIKIDARIEACQIGGADLFRI